MVKPILPTLKEKKRYVVYEILSQKNLDKNPSIEIVKKTKLFLGLFESAKAGLQSITYDQKLQRGVLRVSNKFVDKLKISLALINDLEDGDVAIKSIGVSGILKKAKNKYMAG
jgi:ribonuclease P/MRP protein subunit POP5